MSAGTPGNLYKSSHPDVSFTAADVENRSVSSAPGTTAPLESFTSPLMTTLALRVFSMWEAAAPKEKREHATTHTDHAFSGLWQISQPCQVFLC
jgi:hypothetical protein